MSEAIIQRILRASNISATRIHAPEKGYRNQSWHIDTTDGQALNVILYKAEPQILARIRAANSVSDFLAEQGVTTRQTQSPIICLDDGKQQRYAAIYTYLPGSTTPWEAYTMRHIKQLGATMSHLHVALAAYNRPLPSVCQEYQAIAARMKRYFQRPAVRQAVASKLELSVTISPWLVLLLARRKRLPEQQALHMDFVRGNILFDGFAVSGILDFGKTAHGPRIFDIARTLAFLLVDCKYKPEDKIRKYFLQSGYNKRGSATFHDMTINGVSILESLVDFFLLYDLYKFLRHNPYEYLQFNEHFIRTRDFLINRQVIAYNELNERVMGDGRHGSSILEKATDFAK